MMRIVYYAHHHGSGHRHHARRLQESGVAQVVTVGAPGTDHPLPPDVDPTRPHQQDPHSPFHWTPTDATIQRRFADLHRILLDVRPDLVMVDVSVEAAVFCHLAGFPVAHRLMPGDRDDAAHQLAYASTVGLFAYYPHSLQPPGFAWEHKTAWIGMLDETPAAPASLVEPATVAVLSGSGGDGVPVAELVRAARTRPHEQWHVLGPTSGSADHNEVPDNLHLHGWVDDPRQLLSRAELVVCGAGHNTIATVAGLRRPALVIPEPRPHREQEAFAERLSAVLGQPIAPSWHDVDWRSALTRRSDPDLLARGLLVGSDEYRARLRHFVQGCLPTPPVPGVTIAA